MKNYNVDDISKLLDVDKETVRRWIRSGKLPNSGGAKKDGKIVSESQLLKFLSDTPKYMNKAIVSMNSSIKNNPGAFIMGLGVGAIGAGIASLLVEKKEDINNPSEIELITTVLKKEKNKSLESIKEKEEKIQEILNELDEEKDNLAKIDKSLNSLSAIKE